MSRITSLTLVILIMLSLIVVLAPVIPVKGIMVGAIVEVTPTTLSPGAPFNATLDTGKITGQWVDFYLSDNGYARIDPEKDILLAKGVQVDRTVTLWNVTFIVPPYIKSGTWYLKATDDGGASVAVSQPITVTIPPKVEIVSSIGGDNIVKWGEEFNITVIAPSKPTEAVYLNFFLLKNRVYKWLNVTDVIWNATTGEVIEKNKYIDVTYNETGTTAEGYWYLRLTAKLVDFAPEFFLDREGLGFYYVVAYIDGMAAGTTLKIKPSIEVEPKELNVEGKFNITGHHFPYTTTILKSTWQQIGTDVVIYYIKLIPPKGPERVLDWTWPREPTNATVSDDGTFTYINVLVPAMQGGGKEVKVVAYAFAKTDTPVIGEELVSAATTFILKPKITLFQDVNNAGTWVDVTGLDAGDWIKIEGTGFIVTGEVLKVILYNVTNGAFKKLATLPILRLKSSIDGNITLIAEIPVDIDYTGVKSVQVFINGTIKTNYASTASVGFPEYEGKVFVNPRVGFDKVSFVINDFNEIGVAKFTVRLVGFEGEIANVTLYKESYDKVNYEYEYVLGLIDLVNGFAEFQFTLPEVPYGKYAVWVNRTTHSVAEIPVNATLYVKPTIVYSTTAEVTVSGKGFPPATLVRILWDGVVDWFTVETNEKGSFTATKTIPGAAPGLHVITIADPEILLPGQVRVPTTYITIQAPPVKPFTVFVRVGQVYMTGEIAEIHVLTTFDGKPVKPVELKAELWFNSDPELLKSLGFGEWKVPVRVDIPSEYIAKIDEGWYVIRLPLKIMKDTRMPWLGVPGVYTVKVVAAYSFDEVYRVYDTGIASFTVSPILEASVISVFGLTSGQQMILAQLSTLTDIVLEISDRTAKIENLVVTKSDEILVELRAFKDEVLLKLKGLPEVMVKLLEPKIKDIVETASGDIKAVIETRFGVIETSLSDLNARIAKVMDKIVEVDTAIGTVKIDLSKLIKDVKADLSSGQVEIKTVLGDIKGKVESIEGIVATVRTDLGTLRVELPGKVASALKAALDEIRSGIADVKSGVDEVKSSVETAKSDIVKKVEDTAKTISDKVGEVSGSLTAYGVIIIILVIITLALTAFIGLKKKP